MSGPKRHPDRLNTIGVVVVGICAAVLVYVTIVALQAFYMNDTSEVQTMADYGGQDTQARHIRADQTGTITAPSQPNPAPKAAGEVQTYRIPIDYAIKAVVADAKAHPGKLVPIHGDSNVRTVLPIFGRGKPAPAPVPAGSGDGSGAAPAPAPAPGASGAGAGSSADSIPRTTTGGQGPGGGAPSAGATSEPAKTPAAVNNSTTTTNPKITGTSATPPPIQPVTTPKKTPKTPKTPAGSGSAAKGNAP